MKRIRRDSFLMPAIALAGAGATWAAAVAYGMTLGEAVRMVALSGGAAVCAGAVGGSALLVMRRRSILAQLTVVALVGIAAVVVGVVAASKAMFLSNHDQRTLTVILLSGGTVALLIAVWLGRRVAAGNRSLRQAIRSISAADAPDAAAAGGDHAPVGAPATAELAELSAELERMTRRLDDARARERAVEDSRRELIAWVSHDLRTPLAGLRATAEALADGVLSEASEVDAAYGTLKRETDRLADLVDDLFELAVIQAGALELHLEQASLDDLVSDALSGASMHARAQGVRLEGRLAGPVPDVPLSPSGLGRVLRNLLENAIRHTPHDGTVLVEAGVDGDLAFVSVLDGCGGIPEADLQRVFEPAFRGERARTPRDRGGAGLGLAIAKGIVEAHSGDLRVSNDGPGCRFVLRLPLWSGAGGRAARAFVKS